MTRTGAVTPPGRGQASRSGFRGPHFDLLQLNRPSQVRARRQQCRARNSVCTYPSECTGGRPGGSGGPQLSPQNDQLLNMVKFIQSKCIHETEYHALNKLQTRAEGRARQPSEMPPRTARGLTPTSRQRTGQGTEELVKARRDSVTKPGFKSEDVSCL